MNDIFERSRGLLKDKFAPITIKKIAVIGLGGVGGTCFEALVRTGFNKFIIIDHDIVTESNLNRQVLYTSKDIGKSKVEAAKQRAIAINPNIEVKAINCKVDEKFDLSILNEMDYIVDAIDDINAKILITKYCINNNLPLIVSLGMANRLDPSKVCIKKLNQTTMDPLAKKFRYELKKEGVDIFNINVCFSSEEAIKEEGKLNSIMTVPSSAGLNMAYYIINNIKE